jgi:hypothetical protein
MKTNEVKLPKKFEMKHREYPFVYDDNWISNGEFMVKKQMIKDCFKHCIPNEEARFEFENYVPQDTDSNWVKTDMLFDNGNSCYLRVFKCIELGKIICFKDEYINHFNIKSMNGKSYALSDGFISDDANFALMPYRNTNTDLS